MSQSQTYDNYKYYMPMVKIIDISDNMIKIELCVFLLQGTETTKKGGQAGKQKKDCRRKSSAMRTPA